MVATGKQRREGGTRLVVEEVVKVGLGEAVMVKGASEVEWRRDAGRWS